MIFNLWAIPVVAAILLLQSILGAIWAPLIEGALRGWTWGILAVAVGGLGEAVGVRARLFFLPVWVIGLGLLAYKLGVVGSVCFVVLLTGGVVWIHRRTKKQELAKWEKICRGEVTDAPPTVADEAAFWRWAGESLFLPTCLDYTKEVCEHGLRVIGAIRRSGYLIEPEEIDVIREQQDFLTQAKVAPVPLAAPGNVLRATEGLLAKKLKAAETRPATAPKTAATREDRAAEPPARVRSVEPDSPPTEAALPQAPLADDEVRPPSGQAVELSIAWGGYYAAREGESQEFRVFRLLDFNQTAYHATLYREKFPSLPRLAEASALTPAVWHVPMDARGLLAPPLHLVGSTPLKPDDLDGYMTYLELHEVPVEERASLQVKLIGFSHEIPLRIRLTLEDGKLGIAPVV